MSLELYLEMIIVDFRTVAPHPRMEEFVSERLKDSSGRLERVVRVPRVSAGGLVDPRPVPLAQGRSVRLRVRRPVPIAKRRVLAPPRVATLTLETCVGDLRFPDCSPQEDRSRATLGGGLSLFGHIVWRTSFRQIASHSLAHGSPAPPQLRRR